MPGINTKTSIHIESNYRMSNNELPLDLLVRAARGHTRLPITPGQPDPNFSSPEPFARKLSVDSIEQEISFTDDYWGGRESFKTRWYRMSSANVFLAPFEIGNLESFQHLTEMHVHYEQMKFTGRFWLHAIVGLNVGKDASATQNAREWAKNHGAEYYEVTIDNGPSIDEMLTEVVRHARLLPEKTKEAIEALWEQQLNERDARNRAQSQQQKPKKAVKVAKPVKEVPKDQWTKTERGWVAPGSTATATTASSSRGCIVM